MLKCVHLTCLIICTKVFFIKQHLNELLKDSDIVDADSVCNSQLMSSTFFHVNL